MLRGLEFPILRREMLGLLRTPRAFWSLVAAVALSAVVPLFVWPVGVGGAPVPGSVASLVAALLLTQATVVLTIVPLFASTSMTREREQDTWDSLLATRLTLPAILFAKAAACLAYVLLLLAATAPVFVVLELLGGVDGSAILKSYLVIGVSAVMAACLSLLVGFRLKSARRASIASIGLTWALTILQVPNVVTFLWSFPRTLRALLKPTEDWPPERRKALLRLHRWAVLPGLMVLAAFGFSPLLCVFLIPGRMQVFSSPHILVYGLVFDRPWGDLWPVYTAYAVVVAVVSILCLGLLDRIGPPEPSDAESDPWSRGAWGTRLPPGVRLPQSRAAKRVIELGERGKWPWRNVVFLKELRCARGAVQYTFSISLATGALLGLLAYLTVLLSGPRQIRLACAGLGFFLDAIIAIQLPTSLTEEREGQRWDLLRGTQLSAREILFGKTLAVLYWGLPVSLGMIVGILGLAVVLAPGGAPGLGPVAILSWIEGLCVAGGLLAFATAASALSGVIASRSTTALAGAFALTFAPFAFLFLPPGPAGWLQASPMAFAASCAASGAILWLIAATILERDYERDP